MRFLLLAGLTMLYLRPLAQSARDTMIQKDITYAESGGRALTLDFYKLSSMNHPPLVVWIHGGAWHSGSKANPPLSFLDYGYALASVDFRLSTEKPFPAQVFDIKAAIRYLRAHADQFGFDGKKIIIWGASSGGHLAALVATTNDDKDLEGNLGAYLSTSSSVQGCIDYYGPTDLLTILAQSTPHGLNVRLPALAILLGKPVDQVPALAKQASPVYQADPSDPPMYIVHGEQDIQVPINQSIELASTYQKNKVPVRLEFVPQAGHSDPAYFKKDLIERIDRFLKEEVLK